MVQEKRQRVQEIEIRQEEGRHSLESLVTQAAGVWEEVQDAESLQNQTSLQVQDLLGWIERRNDLLKPSEELIKSV